ncbi:aminotransferase class I/II-fold pyridoxal phosphate-dependent enzyme [Paenibacillus sp. D9]|uniref:aminotransferase class I/II-fold pyridoxal phosphate-dependent enzyme n=1 Tax=Paenibacillus TaxID=44249 RepID=UPI0008411091|nr:aminotransferase class I/II-fold pyridoxal phosphate-dependent enzyme [Paenibacillus sp. D9]
MNQSDIPLLTMLNFHTAGNPVSFHVPGHKGGTGGKETVLDHADSQNSAYPQWLDMVMKIDVTELASTDDLHDPSGAILEAQLLAAECFGAEETSFLVGGSTSGNIALIIGTCLPGDLVLVQRNVHKSVLNGLQLSGARAVFLAPEMDKKTGIGSIPSLRTIQEGLALYPDAKAVFLTNPNYYGLSVDLRPYAEYIHEAGAVLLVDEAHGAHYGLHPSFPGSALQAGADGVVQSTHKTLSALTMGAMLHMQGERLDRSSVKQALTMIQSSSPSFPILASLDAARAKVGIYGENWFEPGLQAAKRIRDWASDPKAPHPFRLLERELQGEELRLDPLRIVLEDASGCLSGFRLQKELELRGCWPEMADARYVVLIVGARSEEKDADALLAALEEIASVNRLDEPASVIRLDEPADSRRIIAPLSESENSRAEVVSLPVLLRRSKRIPEQEEKVMIKDSAGRLAAERIIPYPPGIPLVYEGERITSETAAHMQRLLEAGARFQGMSEEDRGCIAVRLPSSE